MLDTSELSLIVLVVFWSLTTNLLILPSDPAPSEEVSESLLELVVVLWPLPPVRQDAGDDLPGGKVPYEALQLRQTGVSAVADSVTLD